MFIMDGNNRLISSPQSFQLVLMLNIFQLGQVPPMVPVTG